MPKIHFYQTCDSVFGTVITAHIPFHSILSHAITSLAFLSALSQIHLQATDLHDTGFDASACPTTTHFTSKERNV